VVGDSRQPEEEHSHDDEHEGGPYENVSGVTGEWGAQVGRGVS
jgi:hypothetical protein